MIIRAIPVPPDLPLGFEVVLVMYAKIENRDTRFNVRAEQDLIDGLAAMDVNKRHATIAEITSAIAQMLLQSSDATRRIRNACKG